MVIRGGECKTICIMIVGAVMLLKTGINYVIAKLCIKQGSVGVFECIVVERNPNEDFSYYMDYFFLLLLWLVWHCAIDENRQR
jgi:hypothetical protein